jgi:small-conductance mechanosensitive channel
LAARRIGLDGSVSRLLGSIVRIVIALVVIVAAISLLGFAAVSLALNEALLFLPKLFAAIVLVLAGIIVGQFVGEWVARLASQMALGETLGQIARVVIIAVFVMTALTQLGVPTQIMTAAAGILLFAAAISVALALGLGGRDVTRQLSAGRQVRSAFQIGQQITVGDLKGEIISLETAATVLRTSAGQTVRVPHHLLIETVVQID